MLLSSYKSNIMPSPETQRVRSVEEISKEQHIKWLGKAETAQFKDSGEMTVLPYGYLGQAITETLNQDRTSIHTSLVAAVEGKRKDIRNYPTELDVYNQALDDTLTIINSIFKE